MVALLSDLAAVTTRARPRFPRGRCVSACPRSARKSGDHLDVAALDEVAAGRDAPRTELGGRPAELPLQLAAGFAIFENHSAQRAHRRIARHRPLDQFVVIRREPGARRPLNQQADVAPRTLFGVPK